MGLPVGTIQEFVALRGIKNVLHFTRAENVDSIVRHGLLTRSQCALKKCSTQVNDPDQHDRTDAVCTSISFPNYKLFYSLRCDYPNVEWVVVLLDPKRLVGSGLRLLQYQCCKRSVAAMPLQERKGLAPLQAMFVDGSPRTGRTRNPRSLHDKSTGRSVAP